MAKTSAQKDEAGEAAGTGRRRESKEKRREQLINATIDSLARRGYASTTLANVSDGARLSRGIVNFHFDSKDNLLIETLQFMSDEYQANWKARYAASDDDTASRLAALVTADLDRAICTPRKVSAWFALMAEAKSRPAYQKLVWERDARYRACLTENCRMAKEEADYTFDPETVTAAIYAMQEGLWLRLALGGREYRRATALKTALEMLGTVFPCHFAPDGMPLLEAHRKKKGRRK